MAGVIILAMQRKYLLIYLQHPCQKNLPSKLFRSLCYNSKVGARCSEHLGVVYYS